MVTATLDEARLAAVAAHLRERTSCAAAYLLGSAAEGMDVLRWVVESGHKDWIRLAEALGVKPRP
jgi:hypothetical protein